jgi:hypothetical protein
VKKCPNCGQIAADENNFCTICGVELVVYSTEVQLASTEDEEITCGSIILFLLIVEIVIRAPLSVIVQIGVSNQLFIPVIIFQILIIPFYVYLAVRGYRPEGASPYDYLGMLFLGIFPVLGLIPSYYAGKAIARDVFKIVGTGKPVPASDVKGASVEETSATSDSKKSTGFSGVGKVVLVLFIILGVIMFLFSMGVLIWYLLQ